MKSYTLPPILLLALTTASQAAVLVNFDGAAGVVTSSVNFGTSANTVLATTTLENDTQRSTVAYGTTLATNGVDTYSGPTLSGGLYMNAIYNAAQPASNENWAQIINNGGSPASDYIQIRRNGTSGALATSTTRGVFTFAVDAGGPYGFDSTSTLSLTGGLGAATSDVGRWVVVSGGSTYISESVFDPVNNNNTTVYDFTDPDATNWASWTPSSDLSNIPGAFSIVGTSLDDITQVGFYFEKIGATGQNPTFRVFTADLVAIPEPTTTAVMLGFIGTLGLLLRRRTR